MGTVERTHPPTPRRLAEARKQGRFARSEDLAIAASLLLLTTATALMGSRLTTEFAKLIRDSLAADAWRGREIDSLTQQVQSWMGTCLHLLVPVLGITFAVSIAVRVLQSGFTWNFHHIQPDIVRLDPVQGMMRMASGKKLLEAIMNILKVSLVAVGVAWSLQDHLPYIASLYEITLLQGASEMVRIILRTAVVASLLLLFLGVVDFFCQRHRFIRSLRMTPEEIREEQRAMYGDPLLSRQRQTQHRALVQAHSCSGPSPDRQDAT